MKAVNIISVFTVFILFLFGCTEHSSREIRNIDIDWKFALGDFDSAYYEDFDDSDWRELNLPHDWSIEGDYSLEHESDWQSGYLPTGIGWYRKNLKWEDDWKGKKVSIVFDGVYLNSQVWINGKHLGYRPNGYVSFNYDLTPYLNNKENIIAVKVDHSNPLSGRWYTGSGIYRHVWLNISNKAYIPKDELFFKTNETTNEKSNYSIECVVTSENGTDHEYLIRTRLLSPDNRLIDEQSSDVLLNTNGSKSIVHKGTILKPKLWSPDHPDFYFLEATLFHNDKEVDQVREIVGFRDINVSAKEGLILNGIPTKIKGVCDHHTAGAVGAAVPDDVLYRRLKLLKDMGCNGIRTSHNPFSPTFYDMCDTMGFIVLNEAFDGWVKPKARDDYGNYFEDWWEVDLESIVKRDRNHPSVFFWSLGNEVFTGKKETQFNLIQTIRKFDPTRLITQGGIDPTRNMVDDYEGPMLIDIKGFNGKGEEKGVMENFHKRFPNIPILGTEIPHTYQTRGVYRTQTHIRRRDFPAPWEVFGKKAGSIKGIENKITKVESLSPTEVFKDEVSSEYYQNGAYHPIKNPHPWSSTLYYQSSYDNAYVRISARKQWQIVDSLDFVMGHFRWGSFDYLGETNQWPSRCANFGIIDLCGFPKDHYYLYKSLWTEKPMVHILPHWTHNFTDGTIIPLVVYTNCDSVELFLNNKSNGIQKYTGDQLVWKLPYSKGEVKAIGYKNGKVAAEMTERSAGSPYSINLSPDKVRVRANSKDIVHVEVNVVDKDDIMVPYADNLMEFEIEGPAKILATDNGDPLDLTSYKSLKRKAFRGKCLLIIQTENQSGSFILKASSKELKKNQIEIKVAKNESKF